MFVVVVVHGDVLASFPGEVGDPMTIKKEVVHDNRVQSRMVVVVECPLLLYSIMASR